MKNIEKYSCFLLIFLLINGTVGFIKAQQFPIPKDMYSAFEFFKKSKTADMLYINDTVVYLMSKSPLEVFPGYKDLYSSFNLSQNLPLPWMPPGSRVNLPDTYYVIWCLSDSVLYLSDINISHASFCDYKSFFPNNEQYALMEKLTKEKFDKRYPLPYKDELYLYHNTIGMMPAAWCNDTILIKISRGQYLGGQGKELPIFCPDLNDTIRIKRPAPLMELDKWKKIPSDELVFKNGKLISRETTDIF